MPTDDQPDGRFLRVDVKGANQQLWRKLRERFSERLEQICQTVVDPESDETVGDTARQLASGAIQNLKERLARQGLENDRVEAEVEKIYSEIEEAAARTRKIRAEAALLEQTHEIKQLGLSLAAAQMLRLECDEQGEVVFFSSDMEGIMKMLKSLE